MRRLGFVAALVLPFAASCAFLLDFDSLKGDPADAGTEAATGGSAGQAGSGGQAGSDAAVPDCTTPADCDDQDAFTSDDCQAGVCKHAPQGALVDDGFAIDQPTPDLQRVTLGTIGSHFVVSTYAASLQNHDLKVSSFSSTATDNQFEVTRDMVYFLAGLPDAGVAEETPGSVAGIAENDGALQTYFVTYKAFTWTKIWHAALDETLSMTGAPKIVGDKYDVLDVKGYPKPTPMGSDMAATWASSGMVFIASEKKPYGTFDVGADRVAPLSAGGSPAFLNLKKNENNYYWQVGTTSQGQPDCSPQQPTWDTVSSTTPVPGLTIVAFSSSYLGAHAAETHFAFCTSSGCLIDPDCSNSATPFGRNPSVYAVGTSAVVPGGGRLRLATAASVQNGQDTQLVLGMAYADLRDQGESSFGSYPEVTVATQKGAPAGTADYPAVTILGDKVALAWIDGESPSQVLHVRRYGLE